MTTNKSNDNSWGWFIDTDAMSEFEWNSKKSEREPRALQVWQQHPTTMSEYKTMSQIYYAKHMPQNDVSYIHHSYYQNIDEYENYRRPSILGYLLSWIEKN